MHGHMGAAATDAIASCSGDLWVRSEAFAVRGLFNPIAVPLLAGASKSPISARVSGNLMGPSLYVGAVIGVTAGFLMAFQSSAGRLMGFFPNEAEVAASGAARR